MPRCWWRRTRRAAACATSPSTLESPDLFAETEKAIARRARGFKAPWNIIKCVQAAVELPFDEGMKRERELFVELLTSQESAAQRYYFFAEREAAKVPDVPADTPQRPIKTAGIIGAGTMGGGIAMNFANAGIPVTLARGEAGGARPRPQDHPHELREHRQARRHEGRGRRQAHGADHADALATTTSRTPTSSSRRCSRRMDVKKASSSSSTPSPSRARSWPPTPRASTSTRSPRTRKRPGDVIGMHFFSPANVMKLLEIVRGKATEKDVIATVDDARQEDRQDRGAGRRLPRLRRQPHAAPARHRSRPT